MVPANAFKRVRVKTVSLRHHFFLSGGIHAQVAMATIDMKNGRSRCFHFFGKRFSWQGLLRHFGHVSQMGQWGVRQTENLEPWKIELPRQFFPPVR